MSALSTEHIHHNILDKEAVGFATAYRVAPQYSYHSLSQDSPLVAPSPGFRPYKDELSHIVMGQTVAVRQFEFSRWKAGGIGSWKESHRGVVVDCGLTATSSHKTILHYVVEVTSGSKTYRAPFKPLFGEIANPDGSWPAVSASDVQRAFEASLMVYALFTSTDLGFEGPTRSIWAPGLATTPPNESLSEVVTMTGHKLRRKRYVQYVWPYDAQAAVILRSRGQEVLDEEPNWS